MGVRRLVASVIAAVLVFGAAITTETITAVPAAAAEVPACSGAPANDRNGLRVQASHGSVLYVDTSQSQNIDAAYLAYRVTNVGTSAIGDLWASVDDFTGGVVRLANPRDRIQPVGTLSAGTTGAAFFLVAAPQSTSAAQSHRVTIHAGHPGAGGSTELYRCEFSFVRVSETIKAAANKVTSVTSTAVSTLGGTMTITVEGNTGTVGAGPAIDGSMMWLSPAARSNWPTSSLRLESTAVRLFTNPSKNSGEITGSPFRNQLRIPLASTTKYYYTAVYTFRIIGPAPATGTSVIPIAQISSGTQVKHTDLASSPSSTINATAPTTAVTVRKSVATSIRQTDTGPVLSYTVTLANTGPAVTVDAIVDEADGGFRPIPGTSRYDGVLIGDPVTQHVDSTLRSVFTGPFSVPAGTVGSPTTRTLTYDMTADACVTSFEATNTAVATLGDTRIGSGPTTISGVIAAADCGATELERMTQTDEAFDVEATTFPATGVGVASATLNGLIDPNGNAGETIRFEWGTSPTLSGAATVNVGTTSSSTQPYGVSASLSGLQSGTTYYFRVRAGAATGEILSFRTAEPVGLPEVWTTTPTDITSGGAATLTGLVDPNQVTWGAKVRFNYALDSSSGACTGLGTVVQTGFVQSETDNSTEDAIFTGSTPTEVAQPVTGLVSGSWYCARIVAFHDATALRNPSWPTAVTGNWVAFRVLTKLAQTITFPPLGDLRIGDTGQATASTSASGLSVSYSSNTPTICTVSASGQITALAVGTCSITASQPGTVEVSEAVPVTRSLTVSLRAQALEATTPEPLAIGGTAQLDASTTADGLALSYESLTPATCSVSATGVVEALAPGACEVRVTQGGGGEYAAATPLTVRLTVLTPQVLTLDAPAGLLTGGSGAVSASSTATGVTVTVRTLTPDICDVVDGELLAFEVGECELEATQSGDSIFAAADPVRVTVSVAAGVPVVATLSLTAAVIDGPYSVTLVPAGGSGVFPSWSLEGELPGGLEFDSATGVITGAPTEAGEFTLRVTVTDGAGQTSAVRTLRLVVARAPHVVMADDREFTYGDERAEPLGTSDAGAAVSYDVADPTVVTVTADGRVSGLRVGVTTITVGGAGSARVADAAPVTVTVRVLPAMVTVRAPSLTLEYGSAAPEFVPELEGFVFDETDAELVEQPTCSSAYDELTRAGSAVEVTCRGAEAANYQFTYLPGEVTVTKAPQTIGMLDTAPDSTTVGTPITLRFTVSSGAEPRVDTAGPCRWESGVLTVTGVGECVVTVSADESDNYTAATERELRVTVEPSARAPRTPAIVMTIGDDRENAAPPQRLGTSPLLVTQLVDGDGEVAIVSLTPEVCTLGDDGSVQLHAAGECILEATTAETDDQEAATATLQFTVLTGVRTLALVVDPTTVPVGSSVALTAVPSAGAGAITYRVVSGAGCTVSGATLFTAAVDTCLIDATIETDGVYASATSAAVPVTVVAVAGPPRGGDGGDGDVPPPSGGDDDTETQLERETQAGSDTAVAAPASAVGFGQVTAPRSSTPLPARAAPVSPAAPAPAPEAPGSGGPVSTATGARTVGQLLVVGGPLTNGAIEWSLDESVARLGRDVARMTAMEWSLDTPTLLTGVPSTVDTVSTIGLGSAVSLGEVSPATAERWLRVTVIGDGYLPGSTVGLVVTSDPIVVAEVAADARGRVEVAASIPVEVLTAGIHRVRLVGTSVLTDLQVADDGGLVWGPQSAAELAAMDAGTTVIVDVDGRGLRVELLPMSASTPWWLLLLAVGVVGLAGGVRRLTVTDSEGRDRAAQTSRTRRRWALVAVAVVSVAVSSVAVAVGWLAVAPLLALIVGVAAVAALTIVSWPAAPAVRQEQFATAN